MSQCHRTIKLNQWCLLIFILFLSHVSGETDEDIVSIEEAIDEGKLDDSSEEIDSNVNTELLSFNDYYDIYGNNLPLISNNLSTSEKIGIIEEIKLRDKTPINRTSNATFNLNRLACTPINLTESSEKPDVKMVNSKQFLEYISPKGNDSVCALVLFYYPWCNFSMKATEKFNAIGKGFPQLNVIAINAYLHNNINMRFGLVGVPTILFFYNGKVAVKFNSTVASSDIESSLLTLVLFVYRLTGFEPDLSVIKTTDDWTSPLPTIPQPSVDYVLILSAIFLLLTTFYLIGKSTILKKIIDTIRNTWREAEVQHQHVD